MQERHFLSLMQNYTFFAVLQDFLDVFGIHFETNDFVRNDQAGVAWVTTSKLPQLARQIALHVAGRVVDRYHAPNSLFGKDDLEDAPDSLLVVLSELSSTDLGFEIPVRRLRLILESVKSFLSRVSISSNKRRVLLLFTDEDYKVIVASQTLMSTIQHLMQKLFGSWHEDESVPLIDFWAFTTEMRQKGWYRNRTAGLMPNPYLGVIMIGLNSGEDRVHGATLSAAVQRLHSAGRDDRLIRMEVLEKLISDDGSDGLPPCTDTKCLRSTLDNQNVRPKHLCGTEATCGNVDIDQDNLCSMYTGSSFSVIKFHSADQSIHLEKVEDVPGSEFSAISHVWYVRAANSCSLCCCARS